MKIASLILSAGNSRRFGSPKGLALFSGKTAIERLCETCEQSKFSPIVLVVRPGLALPSRVKENKRVEILENSLNLAGQTSSLQIGVRKLMGRCDGVALFLVDHPLVRSETVLSLARAYEENPLRVLRPLYEGRGGHPTIFSMSLADEILAAEAEDSIRPIFSKHGRTLDYPVDDPMVRAGFNTVEEYEALARRLE